MRRAVLVVAALVAMLAMAGGWRPPIWFLAGYLALVLGVWLRHSIAREEDRERERERREEKWRRRSFWGYQ